MKVIEKWRKNEIILFVWAVCEYNVLNKKTVESFVKKLMFKLKMNNNIRIMRIGPISQIYFLDAILKNANLNGFQYRNQHLKKTPGQT